MKYFFTKILPSNMLVCLVVMWSGTYDSYLQGHKMFLFIFSTFNCMKDDSKKQYTGISCYVLIIEHLQHRILHVSCVMQTMVIILIFAPCISFVWSYAAEEDTVCIFTGD